MRWLVVVGLASAGCYSPTPPAGSPCPTGVCPSGLVCSPRTQTCEPDPQNLPDGSPDAPMPATGCYGIGVVQVCPDNPITGQDTILIQTTTPLNTTNSPLCEPYHLPGGAADSSLCVVAAKTIAVSAAGRWMIAGARPLVLIGQNGVVVDGLIDAASHRGGSSGPDSNAAACVPGATPTNRQGGPGGTFGTGGGDGGAPRNGTRAVASQPSPVTALRGGCGGLAGAGILGGAGGRGGGAIALLSAQMIAVGGVINASGAGGGNGGPSGGGGGGGSGGMVVLDAPTIAVGGRIAANGGGGGEGGNGNQGGAPGADPNPQTPLQRAAGGAGAAAEGGDGGDGAAGPTEGADGGNGTEDLACGGGGGGAHGVVHVFPSQSLAGMVSPAAQ